MLLAPAVAQAQLISVTTPTSICAGQTTTLAVAINLPLNVPPSALTITATAPDGLTATVNTLTSSTNATVSVTTSPTLTTGVKSVTVTATTASVTLPAVPPLPPTVISGTSLSVPVDVSVTGLPVVSAITQPTVAAAGSVLSLGTCPVGSPLNYTVTNSGTGATITTGTGPLTLNASVAGQSVRVACGGTCPGPAVAPFALPNLASLNLNAPAAVCAGGPLSLTLLPGTGLDLNQTGLTLTAATPTGALDVSALGPNGVLTVSGGNLTVGNPTAVTVTAALGSLTLVSASVNVNVLAQPAAPTQPGTLTATVGSVLSLTGLCPTGTLLTTGDLTGTGIIPVTTTSVGTQVIPVLCSNGTCLSLPTSVSVNIVTPIISASASAAICFGQPLSLTVLPGNFNLADGIVSITVTGPTGISASAIDNNGVITITGLPAGSQNLTVTASVAGTPLTSVQVPVSVNSVQSPTVVTAAGGTYPSGVSSLSVTQNSGNVLFTVSCTSGTSSYTGTGNVTGSGDFNVSTSTLGVFSYSVVCVNAPCVSQATVVSVSVVAPANQAPVLTATQIASPQTATVGVGFSTTTAAAFSDPDGGVLTYSASPLPTGIAIDPQTGVISGTASTTVGSPFTVVVTATDPQSASVSTSFVLNVVNANQAPVLTGTQIASPQTATVGVGFSTTTAAAFSDPDGGVLTYSASPLPTGISIDPQTGVISGTPSTTVGSPFTVVVTATDPQSASVSTSFVLNVVNANQAPVLTATQIASPQTATVGVGFSTTTAAAFSDPDGGVLTYSASPLPAGIAIDPQTGVISGTPSTTVGSPFTVVVTATDPQSASVSTSFVLNVVNANQAPVLTATQIASPQTATVGVGFSTTTAAAFSDPDGGPLTYAASPLPTGISINPQTGVISGTPSTTVGSPFTVVVTATDPQSASVSTSFVLNVVNANQAPVLTATQIASPQTATVGIGFSTTTAAAFSDPDGGPLTYAASPLPTGIAIDPQTGVISGTPSTTVGSPFTVTVTATDPQSASVSTSFVLNVVNANQAPVLTATQIASPQTATVGVGFSTTTAAAFSDPDGGPLTYAASPLPAGIAIDPQTGVISGTASTTVGSPFTVVVTATDPQSASVSTSFVLNVVNPAPVNQAPVLTGTQIASPQTATVGVGFSTTTAAAFSDPDGGPLTYAASPLPTGISINPQTGVISGTASTTVGSPFTVIVTATDPQSASVSTSFVLNVVNANQAPVLTATQIASPQTATVGVGFSTTTAAAFSDPDGGPLTYAASPLPAGIAIDPQTGVISGTASTTVGSPFTVVVTATDPQSASVSTSFVLTVVEPAVVNPSAPFNITSVTTNNCQVISAGERQVTFTPNYAGLNGQTITFRVLNETTPTTAAGPYTLRLYTDNPVIQLRATQAGSANEASFSYNWLAACGNTTPTNQPPVLTGTGITSPQTATVGAGFTTTTAQAFSDPDGGPLTYSTSPLPAGLAINPQTGVISGTPSTTVGSPFTITVTATDPQSASVSTSFVLNVVNPTAVNQPPVLTGTQIGNQTATVGTLFTVSTNQAFNDPDGGPLTYSASPLPMGIAINPQTGAISGTASTTVGSPFTVVVTATDPQSANVSTSFLLTVVEPAVVNPSAPFNITSVTTNNCQVISAGERQVTFTPNYAGLNGQTITFRVLNETTPTTAAGPYTLRLYTDNPVIQLRATQAGSANEASFSYNWLAACGNTTPTNQPPVLTGTGITSPQTATVGAGFTTTTAQAFSDPDGGPLTYSTSPLPAGLAINPQTGVISGTPSTTVGSPFTITVTATDPQQASVSTSFVLNVVNPTTPPVQTCGSTNLNGAALQATMPAYNCDQLKTSGNIQFTATGGSASGGPVEFKAIGVTDWTTNCQQIIDRETRTACDAAPIEIQVRQLVNGSYVYGTSFIFDIRKQCPIAGCNGLPAPNRAPVVDAGIPNQIATVGQQFTYKIPANAFRDPDGDELLYTASRLPDSFTYSSGFFGAYPTTAEVLTVTVTAFDNSGGSVSTTFTITVNPNPGSNQPSNPNPPTTTPPVQTCGSTNLNGAALQATMPAYNCDQLKTSGNIQFTATGGSASGGPVEFKAIGVTDWTTNCQQIIDRETRTACDAAPIEIQVRQLVNGSYVYGTSFSFNIRAACPVAGCGAARVAAETKAPLDVQVLGNPTRDESVSVDIRGAEGERIQLMVVDTQGFPVSEHTVERAGAVEHQTMKLGRQAGIYLLRVQSQTQVQTVKVLKQ